MTIHEFRDYYGTRSPKIMVDKAFDRLGYDPHDKPIPLVDGVLKMMQDLESALESL